MAKYKLNDIKKDVRIVLGENESISALLTESDDNAIENNEIIASMVLNAIDKVNAIAPLEMLDDVVADKAQTLAADSANLSSDFGGYGKMSLTESVNRFVSFYEGGWDVPVYEPTPATGDAYFQLHSRFEGVRASAERPAVVFVTGKSSSTLEYYPAYAGKTATLLYVPYVFKKDFAYGDGTSANIDIAEKTYKAVIYLIANMYLTSIKEFDFASALAAECLDLLGLASNNAQKE